VLEIALLKEKVKNPMKLIIEEEKVTKS